MNQLSLEASDGLNPKVLRLFDTSLYSSDTIENYLVEVLPPQKSTWVVFHVQKNFSLAVNSSSLGYRKVADVSELRDLPDGIYEIKQSYKPNIHTLAHYYHFRTTLLKLKYLGVLCKHFSEECKKEERVYNEETLQLAKIKQYIDAAEYVVGEQHDKECGIRYYNQAVELIKQFENECGC